MGCSASTLHLGRQRDVCRHNVSGTTTAGSRLNAESAARYGGALSRDVLYGRAVEGLRETGHRPAVSIPPIHHDAFFLSGRATARHRNGAFLEPLHTRATPRISA